MMSTLSNVCGGFEGNIVLDAFAGSGALGLEALSRGAATVHFYEYDPSARRVLSTNVKQLGLEPPRVYIHKADVLKEPPLFQRPKFDLVFLDPPYAYAAADVLKLVVQLYKSEALCADAVIAYEHASKAAGEVANVAQSLDLPLARRKEYGDTMFDVLCLSEHKTRTTNGEG